MDERIVSSYLTISTLKTSSIVADEWIDELESRYPGFLTQQIQLTSGWMDGRLRKRYPAAFVAPYADQIVQWCAAIVADKAMRKRGIDESDKQAQAYIDDRKRAEDEIKEAADCTNGLWDVPLRADKPATGINDTLPISSSQASPYVWQDEQIMASRDEDVNGTSTVL